MSVDHYPCDNCGEIFCDCGSYVECGCGKHWCDDECAKEDGFTQIDEDELPDDEYDEGSCNYCRREDFTDKELLDYALELLNLGRKELVDKKIDKEENHD